MKKLIFAFLFALLLAGCGSQAAESEATESAFVPDYATATFEVGEEITVDAYFDGSSGDATISYTFDPSIPGIYGAILSADGSLYNVNVEIVDTTAPTATAKSGVSFYQGTLPEPEELLEDIYDATGVTSCTYELAPDSNFYGQMSLTVLLSDDYDNVASINVNVEILEDTEAPVITTDFGTLRTAYVGDSISYRQGVEVTDNSGTVASLDIVVGDGSTNEVCEYTVTYIATDNMGNSSELTVSVKVSEYVADRPTDEEILAYARERLDELYDTYGYEESDYNTALCAYRYVLGVGENYPIIGYTGYSDKDDWMYTGYCVLTREITSGDCFTYYSVTRLLLVAGGLETIPVSKVPNYDGDSHHYWTLVKIDGEWYHLDTTPRAAGFNKNDFTFFLWTDAQMDEFSASYSNCFNRDSSLYPASATTPVTKPSL